MKEFIKMLIMMFVLFTIGFHVCSVLDRVEQIVYNSQNIIEN